MPSYPPPIEELLNLFKRMPGIGTRTAERLVLDLLEWPEEDLRLFGTALSDLRKRIHFCKECGNLTERDTCRICTSPTRERQVICVVETAAQIRVIENAGCYRGLYHVLGGKLMPLDDRGPDQLRIPELKKRLDEGNVEELILATSSDVEGEATAHYLASEFEDRPVKITRIASGVPVGADLTFADSATMAMALRGRHAL